jgi:glycosyltransferase involved in cell wall biosynthesis
MAVRDTPRAMLAQAVESILAQTFCDFEFLILDDGSRDAATHASLATLKDERVRVLWEPHRGLTRTLNRGLERAEGHYIARQDADDWSDVDRLARQVAYLEAHPAMVLCGTDAWAHQSNGRRLWRMRLPTEPQAVRAAMWSRNPFVHGSVMFRRAEALEAGGYREEFRCSQDYDFFWRLAERGGAGVWAAANLAEPLYHYRYTGGAISARKAIDQGAGHGAARYLAEARSRGEGENVADALARAGKEFASRGVLRAELKQADHRLLAGEYRDAARAYLRLLRTHPSSALAWGKMARWGVFAAVPAAREWSFTG